MIVQLRVREVLVAAAGAENLSKPVENLPLPSQVVVQLGVMSRPLLDNGIDQPLGRAVDEGRGIGLYRVDAPSCQKERQPCRAPRARQGPRQAERLLDQRIG